MMSDHTAEARAHFLSEKKIVVAGAGIAGLAFVIALRKLWPPSVKPPVVVVYDRDAKETSIGRQGYSLSLHGTDRESGLFTLKQLGLLDDIINFAVFPVQAQAQGTGHFTMWTHELKPMLSVRPKAAPGLPTAGIRIARKNLRRVLVEAASASATICWGTACKSVRQLDDGRLQIQLASDRSTELDECDILVAADGASSQIRGCLRPDDNLQFAGSVQIVGTAQFESEIPSPLGTSFGTVLTGTGVNCFFSPVDEHTLVWGLSVLERTPREKHDSSNPQHAQELLMQARELGKAIKEPFQTVINATDPSSALVLNAMDKPPFAHDDKTGPVIFIGDANHAVSPFAGNGANLALTDGWDLAEQLCQSVSLDAAIRAYDKRSVPRATTTLNRSHWHIQVGHATGWTYWMYRAFFTVVGAIVKVASR
ncbi:putative monooxygenase [Nemania sp. FL0916]|nr:putative monooxygenase [Nemania sp. FL0916]